MVVNQALVRGQPFIKRRNGCKDSVSYQGLNLDGGGSTTMVREGLQGMPQILNTPSGSGIERFNGNNFGVFAQAIPVPEPGSLLFIFSFGVYLVTRRPVQH